jgi:hypothetical protein
MFDTVDVSFRVSSATIQWLLVSFNGISAPNHPHRNRILSLPPTPRLLRHLPRRSREHIRRCSVITSISGIAQPAQFCPILDPILDANCTETVIWPGADSHLNVLLLRFMKMTVMILLWMLPVPSTLVYVARLSLWTRDLSSRSSIFLSCSPPIVFFWSIFFSIYFCPF